MRTWVGCLAIALAALPAHADKKQKESKEPSVAKGFWKILVKPNAKWVLHETIGEEAEKKKLTITVETYDVRKVAGADVARIRWTNRWGPGKDDHRELGGNNMPEQVAVTDKGLYMFPVEADDAKIAERIKGKPSRSDPPKPYPGTKVNQGRYLLIRDGMVCLGEGPAPGDGPCADTCDGWVCISPTDGVAEIGGTMAPNYGVYEQ